MASFLAFLVPQYTQSIIVKLLGKCIGCCVDEVYPLREVEHHMPNSSVNLMLNQKSATKKRKKKVVAKAKTKAQKKHGKQTKQPVISLNYRPRTPEDDAYIIQLTRQQLGAIHEQAFGQPFPEEQYLQYIRSGAPTIVIERENKAIGYYSYLLGQDAKMHVSALVIEPKHQSSGIGKMVMAKLEEDAKRQGVRTLEVFVQDNNAQSLAFTRSLGFREMFRIEPNTIGFQKQLAVPQQSSQLQQQPQQMPQPMQQAPQQVPQF